MRRGPPSTLAIAMASQRTVNVGGVQLDFKVGQDRKQSVVDKNAKGIEFLFKKNKVERVTGFARIAGKGVVEVAHAASLSRAPRGASTH